jgi:hypothetical protein
VNLTPKRNITVLKSRSCYAVAVDSDLADITLSGGLVELTISAGGDELALTQFHHWLHDDVDVVRSVQISTTGSSDTGHMGAVEIICLVISTTTGLANLSLAWASFRQSRKDKPPFTIAVSGELTDEQHKVIKGLDLPSATDSEA